MNSYQTTQVYICINYNVDMVSLYTNLEVELEKFPARITIQDDLLVNLFIRSNWRILYWQFELPRLSS